MELGRTGRILVVDDQAASREATTSVLQRAGYQTLEATNEDELAACCACEPFALAVLDPGLPEGLGRALLERLTAPPLSRVPALCLSATYPEAEDGSPDWQARLDAFLPKPVPPAVLLAQVAALLKGAGARRRRRRRGSKRSRPIVVFKKCSTRCPCR